MALCLGFACGGMEFLKILLSDNTLVTGNDSVTTHLIPREKSHNFWELV